MLLAAHTSARAGDDAIPVNACGSSEYGNKYGIPDYICFTEKGNWVPYKNCLAVEPNPARLFGKASWRRVDLRAACYKHDTCYGTAGAKKENCDTGFYADLKAACRTQLGASAPEQVMRSCYEAALAYNDAVRGQKTLIGSAQVNGVQYGTDAYGVPTAVGCNAYLSGQRAAGVENPACSDTAASDSETEQASSQADHSYAPKSEDYNPPIEPKGCVKYSAWTTDYARTCIEEAAVEP